MRNIVSWGVAAAAAGLLASAAWACGPSLSLSSISTGPTVKPASTMAAQRAPANFKPSPRLSTLAARGTPVMAYNGGGQGPSFSIATPGMSTTSSHTGDLLAR
jgi:hypothetical protein